MKDVNGLFIKTSVNSGSVIISMPIALLAFASENRTDLGGAHKISNERLFAEEVAKRVVEQVGAEEDGSTMFYRLLDRCFDEIFESGVDCFDENFEEKRQLEESGLTGEQIKFQEENAHNS